MGPVRIQRKRARGWKLPANTLIVCRPGKWGNPNVVGRDCETAGEAVALFEQQLLSGELRDKYDVPLRDQLSELTGFNLSCWCALDQPCHATVLLRHSNNPHFHQS